MTTPDTYWVIRFDDGDWLKAGQWRSFDECTTPCAARRKRFTSRAWADVASAELKAENEHWQNDDGTWPWKIVRITPASPRDESELERELEDLREAHLRVQSERDLELDANRKEREILSQIAALVELPPFGGAYLVDEVLPAIRGVLNKKSEELSSTRDELQKERTAKEYARGVFFRIGQAVGFPTCEPNDWPRVLDIISKNKRAAERERLLDGALDRLATIMGLPAHEAPHEYDQLYEAAARLRQNDEALKDAAGQPVDGAWVVRPERMQQYADVIIAAQAMVRLTTNPPGGMDWMRDTRESLRLALEPFSGVSPTDPAPAPAADVTGAPA